MDLNPTKYPILSYLSRLSTFRSKPTSPSSTSDIEQPSTPPRPSPDEIAFTQFQENLREKMPHLNYPDVISSMKSAVSDVSKTRSVLQALGDRPDHETVDTARLKIVEIEESLSKKIEEMILGPKPQGVEDPKGWEENKEVELKLEAEKEREIYKAVVRLDELHEAYESLLREAENRLMKIYRTAAEAGVGVSSRDKGKEKMEEEDDVSEDVIAVFLEGEKNGMRKVELAEKKLKILPEAFGRIPGVVSFDVPGNEIKVLPDSLGGLTLLEELYLSSNLLESLPDSIGLLLNLKVLDVSSNKLKAFPDSIAHCRSLVQLDAGYNALAYLPTNIGFELVNLIRLSVQYNKLRSLPSSICEMRSLRYLDAHFNELRGLPYSIAKLTNLEVLNLGSNFSDLKDLPSTFGDLVSLRELDLSNNQIHALPDNFGRLQNLRMLNLEQNPTVVPPVEVVNAGVEAVKEYMVKRYHTMRAEEEERIKALEIKPDQAGWVKRGSVLLTRSTSALSYMASSVSDSVSDYLAGGKKPPNDPYLDQQL